MEILFVILAITVPIFYLWGLNSFIRTITGGSEKPVSAYFEERYKDLVYTNERLQNKVKSLEKQLKDEHLLASKIMQRASKTPDMSIGKLVEELFPPEPIAPAEIPQTVLKDVAKPAEETPAATIAASIRAETPKIVEELPASVIEKKLPELQYIAPKAKAETQESTAFIAPKAKTEPKKPAAFIAPQTAPKPAFDWANWFSDNAINLLLFVGAFLVVAAVTFFTWSNWGNISNEVKFGGVLIFTAAWYLSGMLFNRGENFKTVGITFVTIGAILTPFVGVCFQQFILNGDAASIGIVWLITSIISTAIYTVLSLAFQRRYFTYFGTLSILAMLLSVVQINSAPPAYFILAGSVTALILLVGRMSLRFFPYLDNYMGQDYELSSVGTLLLSLIAGLAIVFITGEPPFFSLDVFAVGLVTVVYLWVYCSLHHEAYYLLGTQLLTVLVAGHGAFTFTHELMNAFTVMFVAQFALQVILHQVYKSSQRLHNNAHDLSIVLGSGIYLMSIFAPKDAMQHYLSAGMAFALMMQLSFYARRFGISMLYYACVTLSYATLTHALFGMDFKVSYWGFAFIALGLIETITASFVRDDHLRRAQLGLSLLVMASSGFLTLLAWNTTDISWLQNENVGIAFGTALAALLGFAIISYVEERRSYKLLPYPVHIASAFVGVAYYVESLFLSSNGWSAVLALAVVGSFYMAYRHKHDAWLMSLAAVMTYPALFSYLNTLENLGNVWAYSCLTLAALHVVVAYLPLEKNLRQGIAYVGMFGLAVQSVLFLLGYSALTEISFIALGIFALVSGYELRGENPFFARPAHLIGIVTAMAIILVADYRELGVFNLLGYAILFNLLLALYYRHVPHSFNMMSLTASSHIVLWYLLQTLGMGMQLPFHLALSALHLGAAYMGFIKWEIRASIAKIGIWGMVVFISIAAVLGHPAANQTSLSLLMVWLGLGFLAFFEESQRRLETPLIPGISRQLPIISAAIAYVVSLSYTEAPLLTMAYGCGLLYFLLVNYRHSMEKTWLYAGMVLLYPIFGHGLFGLHIDIAFWGIVAVTLSSILSFASFTPFFTEQTRRIMSYVGLTGLTLSIAALFIPYNPNLLTTAYSESISTIMLVTALSGLLVFALFAYLERRGEAIVDPIVHYIPIVLAFIGALVSYPLMQAPLTLSYSVTLLYFLLTQYRQSTVPGWLYASMVLLYPILIYSLWSANVPYDFWLMATAALGTLQILLLYSPLFDATSRKSIMQIGIAGLGLSALAMLMPEKAAALALLQGVDSLHMPSVLISIAVFALFGILELRQTERRVDGGVFLLPVGLAVFGYIVYAMPRFAASDIVVYNAFYSIGLALATSLSFAIVQRHMPNPLFSFGMTLAFYPALIHLLDFMGVPLEFYPPAIAALSMALYLLRKRIVGEMGAGAMTFIILAILGITAVSPYFVSFTNVSYQVYSWTAGYSFLLIFWHSRIVEQRQLREWLLAGGVYLQYLMHLQFAIRNLSYIAPFSDYQWFTAALALVLLLVTLREAHFNHNKLDMILVYVTAAIALLPAYYQILSTDVTFAYALLGVIYGLIIMGVGILYRNTLASGLGILGLIIAVLIPMGEFILNQEWWVILLSVGLVLIIVAVTLTSLRRNSKKKVLES